MVSCLTVVVVHYLTLPSAVVQEIVTKIYTDSKAIGVLVGGGEALGGMHNACMCMYVLVLGVRVKSGTMTFLFFPLCPSDYKHSLARWIPSRI